MSTFAKNGNTMIRLDMDKFKNWTGLNRQENDENMGVQKHRTPQAALEKINRSQERFAFNNDRSAIGSTAYSQYSGIMKKSDYDPMNVKDIEGATSLVKSHIQRKVFNKKSDVDKFFNTSAAIGNGMRLDQSSRGSERIFDTKRFMRVDDIEGARPVNKRAITNNQKQIILSNDPRVEENYHNSQYFIKNQERQGRLPFTRRVNKGYNKIDKSLVSSMDPLTGEKFANPYLNISLDRPPIERFRKFKDNKEIDENQVYQDSEIQNIRAKQIKSKRSHKLGLSKGYDRDPNTSMQKGMNQKSYENLDVGAYTDAAINQADNNRTLDYAAMDPSKPMRSLTHAATPEKMHSKRENRLREFYARSQRKEMNRYMRSDSKNDAHFKSIDRALPKGQTNALTMMDISHKLDQRNIDRHKGRNLFLDSAASNFNDSSAYIKKHNSGDLLPRLKQAISNTPMNHQRGVSNMDKRNNMIQKDVTRSNFFNNLSSNDFIASKISMNPITGQLSPVQNQKAKVL